MRPLPRQRLLNAALLAAFGSAASLAALPALAQQAPAAATPAAEAALPAVTVTADTEGPNGHVTGYVAKRSAAGSKTDTPIVETPQSISVITADRMNAIGATNVRDALSYTPGVNVSPYGSDSRYDWINIRGFDGYAPGFYRDGLPLRNNNTWGLWKTENYGMERIEVLRGPASVLYGQGSPGGIVNITSKLPQAEPIHELQLQYGNGARKQVAADFAGTLDTEGKVTYRLVGVLRDGHLPMTGGPNDRQYLAPSLTWKPSADTTFTVQAEYLKDKQGVSTRNFPAKGSLFPTAIGSYIPSKLNTSDATYDHLNQEQKMLGYSLEHRFNDTVTVRQKVRYGDFAVDYAQVSGPFFVPFDAVNTYNPINYQYLTRSLFGSRERTRATAVDNQAQIDLKSGDWSQKILVGLDYQQTRIDQYTFSGGSVPLLNIYAPVYGGITQEPAPYINGVNSLKQTGLYLQDQIKWGDRWLLTLGGRYDQAKTSVYSRFDDSTQTIKDHKFTKRGALTYLAPNGLAPYISYAESFSPTLGFDPSTKLAFKPETGKQVEAGIRYQPEGQKALYSAAVFDLKRRNYVTYDANFMPKQTGEISVRGLELEATTELMPRMNLTASYAYTWRADVTASANASEIGKQDLAVPRSVASVWADYRFTNGIKIGMGVRYNGATHGNGEVIESPNKVPAYTLVDAMIGYDFERWSLALNLRNLTNKTYVSNCAYSFCYLGDQRTAVATATYRW